MQKLGDAFLHSLHESFSQLEQELLRMELLAKASKFTLTDRERFAARVTRLDQKFQSLGIAANLVTAGMETQGDWRPNPALLDQLRKLMENVGTILGRLAPSDPRDRGKGSLAKQVEKMLEQGKQIAKTVKTIGSPPGPSIEKPDIAAHAGDPVVAVVLMAALLLDMLKAFASGKKDDPGPGVKR